MTDYDIRYEYLATAAAARELVARSEVRDRWDSPSALAEFSVAGLAGHLARAVLAVVGYLDAPVPAGDGEVLSAGAYYARAVSDVDLHSPLHVGIRQRGVDAAAGGHGALVARIDAAVAALEDRLTAEAPDRRMTVFAGAVITLDGYLATRLVELTVHIDDLAVSVGVATPDLPAGAADAAIECMVETARVRHGDLAVIRALSRRERDPGGVIPVF